MAAVQVNLFGEDDAQKAVARPFVKWVGGKKNILSTLLDLAPDTFESYSEPFIGGGAMFFALRASGFDGPATISDYNERLVKSYQAIRDDVDAVIDLIKHHVSQHDIDYFRAGRVDFSAETDPVKVAAWFIYLNKTCFNGVYRVNSKNEFNVPMGTEDASNVLDEKNLRAVSRVLHDVTILHRSFTEVDPTESEFIYLDPPYDATYTGYSKSGFSAEDQAAVADLCRSIDAAGNKFMASNSDTPLIRELYEGFDIQIVKALRSINRDGKGRGRVGELLIRNF